MTERTRPQVVRTICPMCESGAHSRKVSAIVGQQSGFYESTALSRLLHAPTYPVPSSYLSVLGSEESGIATCLVFFGLVVIAVNYFSDALRSGFMLGVGLVMFTVGAWWIFRWQTAPKRFLNSEAGQVAVQTFERANVKWQHAYEPPRVS